MSFTLPSDLPTNFVDDESEVDAAYFNGVSAMGNATKAAIATIGYGVKSATVTTEETTTTTTYTDLATTTDQITVPVGSSGKVILAVRVTMKNSKSTGYYTYVGYELSGANTVAANDNDCLVKMGTPYVSQSFVTVLTGLTAGSTVIKLKYRAQSGSTASFKDRLIAAIPLPATDGTHASASFGLTLTPSIGMTPDFWGIREENVDYAAQSIPAGVTGAWVTLIGGGAAGRDGVTGSAPGLGGGGGGRVDRTWVPLASMGATFTLTRGLGGTTSMAAGTSSVFSTGSITLTAGGGGISAYSVGGTASAVGITAECHSGSGYSTNESENDAGAGGGSGGSWSGTTPTNGNYGGASLTVTTRVRNSASPADAAPGHGGAGGGGGAGTYSGTAGTGGHGGLYGGGGGGGGIGPSTRGYHGDGANGYTLIEWQQE